MKKNIMLVSIIFGLSILSSQQTATRNVTGGLIAKDQIDPTTRDLIDSLVVYKQMLNTAKLETIRGARTLKRAKQVLKQQDSVLAVIH